MKRGRRLSPRKEAWVKARWHVYSTRTLRDYLRVSSQTIVRLGRRLGLPPRPQGRPPKDCGERSPWYPRYCAEGCGHCDRRRRALVARKNQQRKARQR